MPVTHVLQCDLLRHIATCKESVSAHLLDYLQPQELPVEFDCVIETADLEVKGAYPSLVYLLTPSSETAFKTVRLQVSYGRALFSRRFLLFHKLGKACRRADQVGIGNHIYHSDAMRGERSLQHWHELLGFAYCIADGA